jgi:hypothetical protein
MPKARFVPAPTRSNEYGTPRRFVSVSITRKPSRLETRDLDGTSGLKSVLCSAVLDDILGSAFAIEGSIAISRTQLA